MVTTYPNRKQESRQQLKKGQANGKYFRWYSNGKLMCEMQKTFGLAEGPALFYDPRGNKVAELIFEGDSIKTTKYINPKVHLIFGKATYHSKVYGGMERADGSSNINESSGPIQQLKIGVYRVDSIKNPELITWVYSDLNGNFFVSVPGGKIAFFPENTDLKKIEPGQYCPTDAPHPSGHSAWSMPCPLIIKEEKIVQVKIHHSSVGYAP